MHWFDVVAGVALCTGGLWSFCRGLTREVLSILGIIAAIMLSFRGYPYVATHLSTFIAHDWLRQVVGFGLIFLSKLPGCRSLIVALEDSLASSKSGLCLRPCVW